MGAFFKSIGRLLGEFKLKSNVGIILSLILLILPSRSIWEGIYAILGTQLTSRRNNSNKSIKNNWINLKKAPSRQNSSKEVWKEYWTLRKWEKRILMIREDQNPWKNLNPFIPMPQIAKAWLKNQNIKRAIAANKKKVTFMPNSKNEAEQLQQILWFYIKFES